MGVKSSRNTAQNNRSDGHLLEYFRKSFVRGGGGTNAPGPSFGPPSGLTATGGVISDYADGPTVYRAHIFTSTGTFNVSALATGAGIPNNVDYLVVAGGGGGGNDGGGGGGGGGIASNHPSMPAPRRGAAFPVSISPYPIVVGSGGAGSGIIGDSGFQGGPSSFGPVSTTGGGYGGGNGDPGGPGGSGGGAGQVPSTTNGGPAPDSNQGFPGASQNGDNGGGGGGGAGGTAPPGVDVVGSTPGGVGLQFLIAGPPADPQPVGAPGPGGGTGWFAGGGGGGGWPSGSATGGGPGGPYAGGGNGGFTNPDTGKPGTYATGGGGGGGTGGGDRDGGNGGSGIVVVRYQIGQLTAQQKATGGAISYYDDGSGMKTIHTFTSTGTFANTSGSSLSIEYVVVAGGGSGGRYGGGGGAGGYLTASTTCPTSPVTVTIGAGGNAWYGDAQSGQRGSNGSQSTLTGALTVTTDGGGAAGSYGNPAGNGSTGNNGGSGGGGGTNNSSAPPTYAGGAGTSYPGPTQQGYPGGTGYALLGSGGGGGGGAGQSGSNGTPGKGGDGLQVPATFRNPLVAPSNTSNPQPNQRSGGLGTPGPGGSFYVAGGGGGIQNPNSGAAGPGSSGGAGGGGSSPGEAGGTSIPLATNYLDGVQSTGGGGAASADYVIGGAHRTGMGGSGIVLIAYPS